MHYGESLLYPHLGEAISLAANKGFFVNLSCNGHLLNKKKIEEIIQNKLSHLVFMIDGMEDKTIKKIRGPAASFEKCIKKLKLLIQKKQELHSTKPEISVYMVRLPENQHQWEAFEDYFRHFAGIKNYDISPLSTFNGAIVPINDLHRRLSRISAAQRQDDEKRNRQLASYRCYFPWHSVSILWDGRVVSCCRDHKGTVILGNLFRQKLKEIWNGQPIKQLRREMVTGKITNELCKCCREANWELPGLFMHYPAAKKTKKHLIK